MILPRHDSLRAQNRAERRQFKVYIQFYSLFFYCIPHYVFPCMYFNGQDENIFCIYKLITFNPVKTNPKLHHSLISLYLGNSTSTHARCFQNIRKTISSISQFPKKSKIKLIICRYMPHCTCTFRYTGYTLIRTTADLGNENKLPCLCAC